MDDFTINVSKDIQQYLVPLGQTKVLNTLSSDAIELNSFFEQHRGAVMNHLKIDNEFVYHSDTKIEISASRFHISEDLRFFIAYKDLYYSKVIIIDLVKKNYSILHDKTYPMNSLSSTVKSLKQHILVCESRVFSKYPSEYELIIDKIDLLNNNLRWLPLKIGLLKNQPKSFTSSITKWLTTIISAPFIFIALIYLLMKSKK